MIEIYQAVLALLDAGDVGTVCTVVHSAGSAPQKSGSKMLVHRDGTIVGTIGGGAVELAVIDRAREIASTGRAELFKAHLTRDLAMCCGGRMEIFLEPIGTRPWLLLFGGGHVGQALAQVADQAGFRVHVIDEREEFADPSRHPRATAITCAAPLDCLDELPWGEDAYAVIVTHDHRLDEDLLARCVTRSRRYLGMIGSRAKVLRFYERYEKRGMDMGAFSDVHAPIGLSLGAREPGEIAVSVVAELIAIRRGRADAEARSMRLPPRADAAAQSPSAKTTVASTASTSKGFSK